MVSAAKAKKKKKKKEDIFSIKVRVYRGQGPIVICLPNEGQLITAII